MTKKHGLRALLVLALALAALGGSAAGAAPTSGLTGTVRRGPVQPVCRVGERCDAPAAGVILVFTRTPGAASVRATTDAAGRYRIALLAGVYSVRTIRTSPIGRGLSPANVKVRAGHVDRIDFSIDTGIR